MAEIVQKTPKGSNERYHKCFEYHEAKFGWKCQKKPLKMAQNKKIRPLANFETPFRGPIPVQLMQSWS